MFHSPQSNMEMKQVDRLDQMNSISTNATLMHDFRYHLAPSSAQLSSSLNMWFISFRLGTYSDGW